MCRVVAEDEDHIILRNDDVLRASYGDWRVTHAEFAWLYEPIIDTDDIGDDKRGYGE
jgi:hypothetical protein